MISHFCVNESKHDFQSETNLSERKFKSINVFIHTKYYLLLIDKHTILSTTTRLQMHMRGHTYVRFH